MLQICFNYQIHLIFEIKKEMQTAKWEYMNIYELTVKIFKKNRIKCKFARKQYGFQSAHSWLQKSVLYCSELVTFVLDVHNADLLI